VSKATYDARKAARRCVDCTAPLAPGEGVCCEECARVRSIKHGHQQRTNPTAHRRAQKKLNAKRRAEAREQKRCLDCGDRHDRDALRCAACTEYQVDRAKERRVERRTEGRAA
jgi:hypothetical protein